MSMRLWPVLLICSVASAATPAAAQTKNFTTPSGVPNYFSNEVGAPLGSGGIVHPRMPRPSVVEEDEAQPRTRATASRARQKPVRHAAASKRKRQPTKVASARDKRRAAKLAEAKKARTAARKAASTRTAARPGKREAKAAAQGRSAPAKPKQATHHSG